MTNLSDLREFIKTQLLLEGISNCAQFLQDMSYDGYGDPEMPPSYYSDMLIDFTKAYLKGLETADTIEEMWLVGIKVGNEHGYVAVDEDDFEGFLKKVIKWVKHFEKV